MSRYRVALLEPFSADAAALRAVLATDSRLEVIGVSSDLAELEAAVGRARPDLALVALSVLRRGSRRFSLSRLVLELRIKVALLTDPVEHNTSTAQDTATRAMAEEGALELMMRPPPGSGGADAALRTTFLNMVVDLAATAPPVPAVPAVPAPGWRPAGEASPSVMIKAIAIVASAGGPNALTRLLRTELNVPVLVAQHIPAGFVESFARTLRSSTGRRVVISSQGQPAEPGTVYLAPDGNDLGLNAALQLQVGVRNNRRLHPNGDVLLGDLALLGRSAVGVVLTGMGEDGLAGARALKAAGGRVLVQDRESCLVYGMPQAVTSAGLADECLAPEALGTRLRRWILAGSNQS